MQSFSVTGELEALPEDDRFAPLSTEIVTRLSRDARLEHVSEILKFMEDHPAIDYGMPGPLTHYMEEFYKKGYEPLLLESIKRKPTSHTLWLLNRVINGTDDAAEFQQYVALLCSAKNSPIIDEDAFDQANLFLKNLGINC